MRLFLCFILLLASCRPHFPLKLTASPYAFEALERVIAEVNAAAGEEWLTLGGEIFISDVHRTDLACGEWFEYTGEIYIYCPAFREIIIMHELGHVMGLQHVNDRESIMYPTLLYRTIPDAAKKLVDEVRQHYKMTAQKDYQ